MAWFGLDKLVLGYDLDAEQRRSNEADAAINAANAEEVRRGYLSEGYYQAALADISGGNVTTGDDNVVGSVDSEAAAGAKEGLAGAMALPGKAIGAIGDASSQALWGVLKNIPWWVYAGGLVALFVWMGGLSLLRGRLSKGA